MKLWSYIKNGFARKKCYFCGGSQKLMNYTDGENSIQVCHLCAEYANRRAFRKV